MKAQVVSFHCIVKNKFGKVLSSTFNQDVVTGHAKGDQIQLRGLADGLRDLHAGEKRRIQVPAEGAYGFYDPKKVIECDLEVLEGRRAEIGDKVTCMFKGNPTEFRLTSMGASTVTLDANHPFAGQDLVFEIEAVDVREALPEEIPGTDDDGALLH